MCNTFRFFKSNWSSNTKSCIIWKWMNDTFKFSSLRNKRFAILLFCFELVTAIYVDWINDLSHRKVLFIYDSSDIHERIVFSFFSSSERKFSFAIFNMLHNFIIENPTWSWICNYINHKFLIIKKSWWVGFEILLFWFWFWSERSSSW